MHQDIKIGTLVGANRAVQVIPQLIPYGFETFSLTFGRTTKNCDLKQLAKDIKDILAGSDCEISSLSLFGNPLMDEECADSWRDLIAAAADFGTDLVTGFAGRITDRPVPESMPRFKEVFTGLCEFAKEKNVRLAIENCEMDGNWNTGDWNIGFSPVAWEMMFEAVPYDNLGLQWEPCHQMVQLVDPIPQLREWAKRGKIFSVHGKDATVAWDVIREKGITGVAEFAWHRTPGFGDSNWADIITILRMNGFKGSIDIEGFHDPVYCKDLEYTGQVYGLNYLKNCRGGDFVPNPTYN